MVRSVRPFGESSPETGALLGIFFALVLVVPLSPLGGHAIQDAARTADHSRSPVTPPPPDPSTAQQLGHPSLVTTQLPTAARPSWCCGPSVGLLAYNPVDRAFFVAASPNLVFVVNVSTSVRGAIAVGSSPFGIAVDNVTGTTYVTNEASGNVTAISPWKLHTTHSVAVQKDPTGIAYDSADGRLFVADRGTANLTVLSVAPLRVIANVSVGAAPIGVTWDATTDQVFVANHRSASVTVIDGRSLSVVASISVGRGPYELAVDNSTDNVYVTDEWSNQVSVLSAASDTLVATVGVPLGSAIDLQGVTYDARHHVIWAAGGVWFAVVINTAREVVVDYLFLDPAGAAYDSSNGDVCVTNTANRSFSCWVFGPKLVSYTVGIGTQSGIVEFVETGLPAGTPWSIKYIPTNRTGVSVGMSETSKIRFGVFTGYGVYGSGGFPFNFTIGKVPGFTGRLASGSGSSSNPYLIAFH